MRTKLTGDLTLYLSTTGNAANDGLTAATPWDGNINNALTRVVDEYDYYGGGGRIFLQLADGTYNGGVHYAGHPVGVNNTEHLTIQGNAANPYAVQVVTNQQGVAAVGCYSQSCLSFRNLALGTLAAGSHGIEIKRNSIVQLNGGVVFLGCTESHVKVETNSTLSIQGGYRIAGGSTAHFMTDAQGVVYNSFPINVDIDANISFSAAFAYAISLSTIRAQWMNFRMNGHTVSGSRYSSNMGAVIHTGGGGANYFPGTVPGNNSYGLYI